LALHVCAREDGIRRSKDLPAEIGKYPNSTNERKKMSNKTIKQRISMVAVTVVTAGLFSAVTAPSANAGTLTIGANGATSTSTSGLLSGTTGSAISSTTATGKMLLSGQISVVTAAGALTSAVVVSGGTIVSCSTTSDAVTLSADKTICTTSSNNAAGITSLIKPNAVGTPLVIMGKTTNSATSWSTDAAITISVVANSTIGVFDAASSFLSVETSGQAAADNVDATYTSAAGKTGIAGTTVVNGGSGYMGYFVKDSNGTSLSTVIGANVTGGCDVGAAGAGTFNAASSTTANSYFQLTQSTANAPAKCVLTITVAGVAVGSRTFTFLGEVASITISGQSVVKKSSTANSAAFFVAALDTAGNSLDNVTVVPASAYYNAGLTTVSNVTTIPGSSSATANGADVTCASAGTYPMQMAAVNASAVTIKSAVFNIRCADTPVNYKASLDKASYVPGDIATLTISATDSKGNLANDYDTIGTGTTAAPAISGGQLTAVTAATSTDTFVNGVKTYKFIVGSTEGSYQLSVDLPKYNSSTYSQTALTVAYAVKASTASVSNADVLKSIVSLIASINKQIQALQKLILKR